MALVTIGEVQSWFTEDRLLLEHDDDLPEEVAVSRLALAAISKTYDVTTWVSTATTPALVRSVISAQVAALRYRKHYADQDEELEYANWLDDWAKGTLEGIVSTELELLDTVTSDEVAAAEDARTIAFLPNDLTGSADEESDIKFKMGTIF
jgi:hypothetical protein